MDNLHDLFEFKLLGMYAAEKRNLDVLDDAASEAKEPRLRDAFKAHREETRRQVERLETAFDTLGSRPRSVDASVVEGLVEEKRRFLAEDPTPEVMDVFNVGAAIKMEHVEIAAYENLITLAEQLGVSDVVEPLRQNLQEEQATLDKLRSLVKESGVLNVGQGKGAGANVSTNASRSEVAR